MARTHCPCRFLTTPRLPDSFMLSPAGFPAILRLHPGNRIVFVFQNPGWPL